jgi:DNA invertase Pin-like site-specific DNA recombinase
LLPLLTAAYDAVDGSSTCKKHKAKLVIAKLDRLSRNVAFIANLLEAGTDFVAADNPHANKPMVQMMAVFAEMERDAISKRTKEALAAAKARGVRLGNPRLAQARAEVNAARREVADAFAARVLPISTKYRKAASAASVESPRRCLRVV